MVEKDAKYDPNALLFGADPLVPRFVGRLKMLAKHYQQSALSKAEDPLSRLAPGMPPSPDQYVANAVHGMAYYLACVGNTSEKQMAKFFRDVASYIEGRGFGDFPRIADPQRLWLQVFLEKNYKKSDPVNYTELAGKISSKSKVPVSEKWVAEECQILGYSRTKRGRPKKSGN